MSNKRSAKPEADRFRIAAQIVAASKGYIMVTEAMKTAGVATPDQKNMTKHKRVYQKSKKLVVVDEKEIAESCADDLSERGAAMPPVLLQPSHGSNSVSTLSGTNQSSAGSTLTSAGNSQSLTPRELDAMRKNLLEMEKSGMGSSTTSKKRWKTSKQKHQHEAEKEELKSRRVK